jgi:hypothetical protein
MDMADEVVIRDLVHTAEAVGALGGDEGHFRGAFDAFLAGDRESFQRLLSEFKLLERCELVCDWICSKYCVLVCLELCGQPTDVEVPDLNEFAAVVARITQDEELVERLANTVDDRDAEGFRALVTELEIERFCHLLCHWACSVRCRLMCEVVCSPTPTHVSSFVGELARAGGAIADLAADPQGLADVRNAVLTGNCDLARGVVERLGLFERCHLVCEWLCTWRCVRICLLLCRAFPIEQPSLSLSEALEFAKATERLAKEPGIFERLSDAIEAEDANAFEEVVRRFDLGRFCIQLCHWICFRQCRLLCRCVCRPVLVPWFTHVGHFDINSDIDVGTGLTNKGLVFAGLTFQGGPGFGFQGCLELRGFCPAASPIDGSAMRYRFVLAGSGTPITGSRVCEVDAGTRIISWPQNVAGVASAGLVPTFQTITIEGAPVADPTPPAPGAPWRGPTKHVIVPDANGWVVVDPAAIAGGFTTLIGFNTNQDVPGGDPVPGVAAGTAVPLVTQRVGTDLGIVFEATRVAGAASPPDFTNALAKIHINNWFEVNLLDLLQFHSGGQLACSPITTALDVEFTADHELMASWAVSITSASPSAPGTVASGNTPRGGFGTHHENTSAWNICSYVATLETRAALTTGLIDNQGRSQQKTFCVGRSRDHG